MINPKLKVGDKVILFHMEDEYSNVPPMTKGVVNSVNHFSDETIYGVKWENGSDLNLISTEDMWKKVDEDLNESFVSSEWERTQKMIENIDVFKYFDSKFLRNYLIKLRDCSLVNMLSAAPYLYIGRDKLAAKMFLENNENEECVEVLDMANQAQSIMVSGTMLFLEKNKREVSLENINRVLPRMAQKVLMVYILTF